MKKFIPAFTIFLLWTAFGYFWLNNFSFRSNTKSAVNINPLDTIQFPTVGTFKLNNYDFKTGYQIFKSNTKVQTPKDLQVVKDSIYATLNKNQERIVLITGKYTKKIVDSLSNPQRGIARAEALKKEFIAFGINPLKIKTESKSALFKYDSTGTFNNGIAISYQKNNDLNTLNKAIQEKHIFQYIKGEKIKINKRFNRYILELKNYLKTNSKAKAQLVIYTDSDGSKAKNYWNALDKIVALRKELYKNYGIKKRQLIAVSKGELEPLYDNTSTDKLKNNRIEITIKH